MAEATKRKAKRGGVMRKTAALMLACMAPSPAFAQATTTYSYDELGRLTDVATDQGPAASTTSMKYDSAGNRTEYKVIGSSNSPGNLDGATVKDRSMFIVVPLNGFTLIPIG